MPTIGGTRDVGLDVVRGLAMVLVVFGHALVGAMGGGLDGPLPRALLLVIYSSHMALFFLVSGLFSHNLAHRPWGDFLRTLGTRLLWPYVVWSVILLTAHYVMSGHTNLALDHYRPWEIFWAPPAIMWFLYALIVAMVLRRVLAPFPRRVTILVGVLLMIAAYSLPNVPQSARFVGLFLLAPILPGWDRPSRLALLGAGLIMISTVMIAVTEAQYSLRGYPAAKVIYAPALLGGPVLLAWLARRLVAWDLAGPLAYLGSRTMAVFVTHILVTAGVRIVLRAAGVDSWAIIIGAATVLGVALPLGAQALADRAGLSRWLGWR